MVIRSRRSRSPLGSHSVLGRTALMASAVLLLATATLAAPSSGVAMAATSTHPDQDLTRWVDPVIGTEPGDADMGTGGGAANTFPGADVPFGMVQWSPDTVTLQHGGYYYQDNRIKGFSLTHLSGAGCDTYQDIPFMPFLGEVTDSPAVFPNKYIATFSHDNEKATAGTYQVRMDNGISTKLSVTQHTGSGRFTYPQDSTATLLVNVSGSISGADDAQVSIGKNTISGYASSGHFCGNNDHYRVYFFAQFDRDFATKGTWKNGAVSKGKTSEQGSSLAKTPAARKLSPGQPAQSRSVAPTDTTVSGPGSGAYVTFDTTESGKVNVKVGLSFVSAEGAKKNLAAENNDKTLEQVSADARQAWNTRLNQIKVTGGTDTQKTVFYTALYHSLLQPNVFSDVDGSYIGFDGQVHQVASGHSIYTNFSGWDIYRSEIQLLALLAPKETSDIANSMVQFAAQGGSWDRWTVANDYTGVMNGDPYHIIVSEAYAFGAKDFDAKQALLSMVRGATEPTKGYIERPGLSQYLKSGYVPQDASATLEYTSADFAIAQLANRLGDSATYHNFMKRAQNWQNLYNPVTGYLQPRNADGSFSAPFDPASPNGFTEGNGAQYLWMVPYNYRTLITALGGNAQVNSKLDEFFTKLNAGPSDPHAFLGNEPTLETPWVYDFTGAPYKTQALINRVRQELWKAGPNGLVGNDDLGEMSSWYVWSALGIYPEIPGRAEMTLNTPEFTSAVVTTPSGQRITVNAPGVSTNTPYIQSLKVNGQDWSKPWLPESIITNGGTLDFSVADEPNTNWGAAAADVPPSFTEGTDSFRSSINPDRLVLPPDTAGTVSVGVQDLSAAGGKVHWQATPQSGVALTPSSGDLVTEPGSKAATEVTVSVAQGVADGNRQIPITFTNSTSSQTAQLVVLVAEQNSQLAALNNVGTSTDANSAAGNFDGGGRSYSRNALAAAGITPGEQVKDPDGLAFTFPNSAIGEFDNITAAGQTITLPAAPNATKLALMGSASNGNSSGTVTITYTDGSIQTATVGFTDWASGGPMTYNNRIVASMPYRNQTDGNPQQITVYLLATEPIALLPDKQVASITLPSNAQGGSFHVFGFAVG